MYVKDEFIKLLKITLIILALEIGIYFISEGLAVIVWGSESNVLYLESDDFDMQDGLDGASDISVLEDSTPTPSPTSTPTPSPTPTPDPDRQAFYDDVRNGLDDISNNQKKIMISIWALCGVLIGFKILRGVFG